MDMEPVRPRARQGRASETDGALRIAFVVHRFPALSETFILNQITGLLERGHKVDIFATDRRRRGVAHPDVERYGLLQRTRSIVVPRNWLARAVRAAGLLVAHG